MPFVGGLILTDCINTHKVNEISQQDFIKQIYKTVSLSQNKNALGLRYKH
jgi:outer membrane murein-binding lipoprotein Lpp